MIHISLLQFGILFQSVLIRKQKCKLNADVHLHKALWFIVLMYSNTLIICQRYNSVHICQIVVERKAIFLVVGEVIVVVGVVNIVAVVILAVAVIVLLTEYRCCCLLKES